MPKRNKILERMVKLLRGRGWTAEETEALEPPRDERKPEERKSSLDAASWQLFEMTGGKPLFVCGASGRLKSAKGE